MDFVQLSKTISHALRHAPDLYGLTLDSEGWVRFDDLLAALRRHRREWRSLTRADLIAMQEQATKQRFEIKENRIRAHYGHSTPNRIGRPQSTPPEFLYHGTAPDRVAAILNEGLRPMHRQYVHLSTDTATAATVGSRYATNPVILQIDTHAAREAGIKFYYGNEDVWLSDHIPPQYISQLPSNP